MGAARRQLPCPILCHSLSVARHVLARLAAGHGPRTLFQLLQVLPDASIEAPCTFAEDLEELFRHQKVPAPWQELPGSEKLWETQPLASEARKVNLSRVFCVAFKGILSRSRALRAMDSLSCDFWSLLGCQNEKLRQLGAHKLLKSVQTTIHEAVYRI